MFDGVDPVLDPVRVFIETQVRPACTVAGGDGVVETDHMAGRGAEHTVGEVEAQAGEELDAWSGADTDDDDIGVDDVAVIEAQGE